MKGYNITPLILWKKKDENLCEIKTITITIENPLSCNFYSFHFFFLFFILKSWLENMDTRLIILALLHFVESRTPVRPVPFRLSTTGETWNTTYITNWRFQHAGQLSNSDFRTIYWPNTPLSLAPVKLLTTTLQKAKIDHENGAENTTAPGDLSCYKCYPTPVSRYTCL